MVYYWSPKTSKTSKWMLEKWPNLTLLQTSGNILMETTRAFQLFVAGQNYIQQLVKVLDDQFCLITKTYQKQTNVCTFENIKIQIITLLVTLLSIAVECYHWEFSFYLQKKPVSIWTCIGHILVTLVSTYKDQFLVEQCFAGSC